jgi:hypothetical protein
MEPVLLNALEDCLTRLEAGRTLEDCLRAYPGLESELRPLLETARLAMAAQPENPPTHVLQRSRTRMLSRSAALQSAPTTRGAFIARFAFSLIAAAFVLTISGIALATASAQALPGDPLYGVKRAAESVRLGLASQGSKTSLLEAYHRRRTDETRALLHAGRSENASLYGAVEDRDGYLLTVDGVLIEIDEDLERGGEIEVGDLLEVEGVTTQAGLLVASSLQRRAFDLTGELELNQDGTWSIGGRRLEAADPGLLNEVSPGEVVRAHLELGKDGILHLTNVEILAQEGGESRQGESDTERESVEAGGEDGFEQDGDEDRQQLTLHGTLEALTQDSLRVSGTTFLIGPESEIDPDLTVGDSVLVEAAGVDPGPFIVVKVEKSDASDQAEDGKEDESQAGSDDGSEPDEPDDNEPPDDD